jgi:hypothetical protein
MELRPKGLRSTCILLSISAFLPAAFTAHPSLFSCPSEARVPQILGG